MSNSQLLWEDVIRNAEVAQSVEHQTKNVLSISTNSNVKGIRVSEVRVLPSASIFVRNIYESTPWMRLVYVSSILTARAYNARVAQLVERVIMRLVKPLTVNFFWSVKPVVACSIPAPGST